MNGLMFLQIVSIVGAIGTLVALEWFEIDDRILLEEMKISNFEESSNWMYSWLNWVENWDLPNSI